MKQLYLEKRWGGRHEDDVLHKQARMNIHSLDKGIAPLHLHKGWWENPVGKHNRGTLKS